MEGTDILLGIGIPPEAVAFFRKYQRSLAKKWYMERNGRFAQNFKYYMLEGLQINIPNLDLLVAGAILLSHEESYIRRVLEENRDDSIARHELARTRERVLALAEYMSKYGAFLRFPHSILLSRVRLRLGLSSASSPMRRATRPPHEYLDFFCNLPEIWEEKAE